MDFIPIYTLNNLANAIGISLGNTEEEHDHTINKMCKRKSDRVLMQETKEQDKTKSRSE